MQVFSKAEDLIDYTFIMTENTDRYAKKHRFTFVDRMQNLTLDIYSKLRKANELPFSDRKKIQQDAISDMCVLSALIKISLDRNFIDHEQSKIWTSKLLDVKNLAGAWMKLSR